MRCREDPDHARDLVVRDLSVAVEQPQLTKRIVERCLLIVARITPLDAGTAVSLVAAAGIGALLRW
jgi:hypothetical protein